MSGQAPRRPSALPASLAGRLDTPETLPDPFGSPRRPGPTTGPASGARVDPSGEQPPQEQPETPGGMFPCPCDCRCSNDTGTPAAHARGFAAAARLRCRPCLQQGHFAAPPRPDTQPPDGAVSTRAPQVFEPQDEHPLFAEHDRRILREEAAQRCIEAGRAWRASLPDKFRGAGDEDLHPQVAERLERVRSERGQHATSMLCVGPYGAGKTWLAYAYATRLVDEGLVLPQQIVHGTEVGVLEPIAYAPYGQVNDRTRAVLNRRVKMILLDDVGRMAFYPRQEVQHGLFARIVNFAYESNLILVMTTTLGLGENGKLEEWIGSTAYERLRYMAGRAVVVDTASRRADVTAQWDREYAEAQAAQAAEGAGPDGTPTR